ncbi:MAG: NHLP family bacteriocin export ABC transporter peptidase/permease/ATPase subunit [Okeania sp. SIO3H1]|nr:NHLP family bacteriocin export ABC transporter peptidase/permease/ATPase subunit [Okeania sp. SIO3H1]
MILLPLSKSNEKKRVKTPTIIQMEAVECGAAALSIILAYYGRIVPLAKLRQECGVSRDGSKASKIVGAARNYGMEANGFKAETLEQLDELSPPYIVFWEFNHFLVVEGFNKHQVFLNDPATGPRKVSWDEFDEGFTGVILTIEPGEEFEKGGRKPSMIPLLYQRLRPSLGAIIYCIIAGFLLVIPGLIVPVFSQIFVDNILVENRTNWLRPLVLGMTFAMILQTLLTLLRLRYLRKLMIKLSVGMSSQFMWHILRLPVGFYAQRYAGEISDRVNINNEVAQVLSGQLATTVIDTVMIVFYGLVMFAYDRVLTLIGISFAAVNILALQWVSRQRVDANMRLVQDEGKLAGASIAGLQSMETLKASALESDFFSRWSGYYAKTVNTQQQLEVTNQVLEILPTFLSSLTSVLVLVVGGLRVMEGEISIGMLVAFQSLMLSFQQPVNTLVGFGSTLQELEGDLNRLNDVLSNETEAEGRRQEAGDRRQETEEEAGGRRHPPHPPFQRGETEQVFEESKLKGYVELRNITFGYSQVDPPLVIDLNLSLQPGQKIALVGGSGSGKSTIAKLICGLYQPWEGEILFDGVPREDISPTALTNSLSMVEQEIFLFGGTVRDNLTLWNPTISTTQLMKACRDAVIHEAVMALPGGYDGELLEGGANLSGGQRQRLEIARALVNNPTILVMDEATSALDAETEKMIVDNLQSRGCSCIIVAHRLSTIRDCDEIIVLEYGEVVQRGTHEEMLQEEGVYQELISSKS